jgi:guanylate kinase
MSTLIIIGGPTGVGESTITREIIRLLPKTKRLITTTTRAPRGKEKDGRDYFFVSKKEFQKRVKQNVFIEHTYIEVRDVYYGSEKKRIDYWLSRGYNVVVNLDIVGAQAMKKNYADRCVTLFIVPDKMENIKKRILHRTPDIAADDLKKRLIYARQEIRDKKKYDFIVINHQDQLKKAVTETLKILKTFIKKPATQIRQIPFPKKEWPNIARQLNESATCSTVRCCQQLDKYKVGEIYATPWGDTIKITKITRYSKATAIPTWKLMTKTMQRSVKQGELYGNNQWDHILFKKFLKK